MIGVSVSVSPGSQVGGASVWTPDETDLQLWSRIDNGNYTIDTGITALQNEGALGGTFDQATGSQQPTEAAINGLTSAKFTEASSQDLASSLAASSWSFLHDGTGMSAAFAIQPNATGGSQTIISTLVASNLNTGIEILANPGNGRLDLIVGNSSGTFLVSTDTTGITANTAHVIGVRLGTGETNEFELWLDGALKTSGSFTGTPDSGAPQITPHLGSRTGIYYDGELAEVVAWSAYRATSVFEADMGELRTLYGAA